MYKPYAKWRLRLALSALMTLSLACGGDPKPTASGQGTAQASAAVRNPDLPVMEKSAAELQATYDRTIAEAEQRLAQLAALDPTKLTFENSISTFEDILDQVNQAALRSSVLLEVSPITEVMDKASEVSNLYDSWFSKVYNDGAVYKVLKAYAKTNHKLAIDERKLLDEVVQSFERNGLTETGVANPRVLALQREINDLGTELDKMIVAANSQKNYFTAEELEGLTPEQLSSLAKEGELYMVRSGARTTLRDVIMTYATNEATRKRAKTISSSRAQDDLPLITTLARKRVELAKILGYDTWADYRAAPRMAKTGKAAIDFVDQMALKLRPKFEKELTALSSYIVLGVNDDNGQIDAWDIYYFKRLYETDELNVDYGALAQKYFPYDSVLNGMFRVYEQVFGLKIEYVNDAEVWHPDVRVVKISNRSDDDDDDEADDDDEDDDDVLGYVYLDMFPRLDLGKMNHFASAPTITGRELDSGERRKAVTTLICNFPVNADGTPKPLIVSDMATLFHEFGHALHSVLGRQRFGLQYSSKTPKDFVEVPSKGSEYWVLDPNVFKQLAIPHPDLTDESVKKLVTSILNAQLATKGMNYERQFGLSKVDFTFHGFTDPAQVPAETDPNNLVTLTNQALGATYLPYPEGTSYVTSFQHILSWGYDTGYYAYAWSDAIAAELTSLFEASPLGYLDPVIGMRYRKEILEAAASRDVNLSVEAFLGRPLDPERKAFLKTLGL